MFASGMNSRLKFQPIRKPNLTPIKTANIESHLDMLDQGALGIVGDFVHLFSQITLDPADYDNATYHFEINVTNTDAINPQTVDLMCGNTLITSISVPKSSTTALFRSAAINPLSGNNIYSIKTHVSTIKVFTAKISIIQTNATKTRIGMPLIANGHGNAGNSVGINWAALYTTATSWGTGQDPQNGLYYRNDSKNSNIQTWIFEIVAANSATGGTVTCALFNKSTGVKINGTEVSMTGSTPTILSGVINDPTHFVDQTNYEVRLKQTGGTAYISNARIYYKISGGINKIQIPLRFCKLANANPTTAPENKIQFNPTNFPVGCKMYVGAVGYYNSASSGGTLYQSNLSSGSNQGSSVPSATFIFNSVTKVWIEGIDIYSIVTPGNYISLKTGSGTFCSAFIFVEI